MDDPDRLAEIWAEDGSVLIEFWRSQNGLYLIAFHLFSTSESAKWNDSSQSSKQDLHDRETAGQLSLQMTNNMGVPADSSHITVTTYSPSFEGHIYYKASLDLEDRFQFLEGHYYESFPQYRLVSRCHSTCWLVGLVSSNACDDGRTVIRCIQQRGSVMKRKGSPDRGICRCGIQSCSECYRLADVSGIGAGMLERNKLRQSELEDGVPRQNSDRL